MVCGTDPDQRLHKKLTVFVSFLQNHFAHAISGTSMLYYTCRGYTFHMPAHHDGVLAV